MKLEPVIHVGTAPHSKNNSAARSLVNSQNCPVNYISNKNTTTLIMISRMVSFGLNPGGCGFSSLKGSID